ncbi:MAG: hypothetical protein AAGG38_07890 [Planctomycetota bacterium]
MKRISTISTLFCLAFLVSVWPNFVASQPGVDAREDHPESIESVEPRGPDGLAGPDRPHGPRRFLTDAQIDTAMQIIAQIQPELSERLEALRERDPASLRSTLERRFHRVRFLVQLKARDPAMFELRITDLKLERDTRFLAQQARQASQADEKDRYRDLVDQIEVKVAEHFDVRQAIREREIESLKQKLESLEERLDQRGDDRKDLIEERVKELTLEDW